jgi:signal transduction histidine kinase
MQKKIIIAIIFFVIIVSATLGIISYLAVNESINRSLQNRLLLAGTIANYIETLLHNNLNRLYDISVSGKINLKDNNWEYEKKALKSAYDYSLFSDGVFLLDKHGNVLVTYPQRSSFIENLTYISYVNQVLEEKKPVISNVYTIEPIKKKVIYAMVPLVDNEGNLVGVAGGIINPTTSFINQLLQTMNLLKKSYIEIIDSNEIVVASDDSSHVLRHHDREGSLRKMIKEYRSGIKECPHGFSSSKPDGKSLDILTFVPLKIAPWGVIIGQTKKEVYAPSIKLRKMFFLFAFVFLGTAIIFAVGLSTSIIKPIRSLTIGANRIAGGDLSRPIENIGTDEIAMLSKSFDAMRIKLAESLESLKKHSAELEKGVLERTKQIQLEQEKVQTLLKQAITSQENERKRVARELHDETLQDLSAILMKIDMCKLYPEQISIQKIEEIRGIVLKTLKEISRIMQNLRPSMLDDLGLEAAIKWLLDSYFDGKSINCFYNAAGIKNKRFSPEIEINLFRIAQETIANIARHAEAKNIFLILKIKDNAICMDVEDDGIGFDVTSLLKKTIYDTKDFRGLGLLGMKERASLIGGNLQIYSMPDCGTRVSLRIPLTSVGDKNV